ncbi:MAG: 50S ribosomal protein L24 [Betaproteobacteria bacterium HGW-Betaproteobacteria-11]|nr:MAG: 50S ribosomal protein L24 [Betaproteobacteria bacterium HGW-Betaproteobacteria-11]
MSKLKKGDSVIVISGREKGKRGSILSWVGSDSVLIGGVNKVKKHVKPNPAKGIQGGVSEKESPLSISNVALFNPVVQKADQACFKMQADGRKTRVFKSNGDPVDLKG